MPSCVSILVVAAPIQLYEFEQLFGQLANFFFGTPILDAVIIIGETGDSGLYGDDFPKWIEDYAEANDHRYINIRLASRGRVTQAAGAAFKMEQPGQPAHPDRYHARAPSERRAPLTAASSAPGSLRWLLEPPGVCMELLVKYLNHQSINRSSSQQFK